MQGGCGEPTKGTGWRSWVDGGAGPGGREPQHSVQLDVEPVSLPHVPLASGRAPASVPRQDRCRPGGAPWWPTATPCGSRGPGKRSSTNLPFLVELREQEPRPGPAMP